MKTAFKSYDDYCKDFIKDNISDFEGQEVYACDLANYLTQNINVNGTATHSTDEAKEYIKFWWDEASDYFQYEKDNFENLHNPFERPEAFHVCMIIQGVQSLLSQCNVIDKNWNDEIIITSKKIEKILNQLKYLSVEL